MKRGSVGSMKTSPNVGLTWFNIKYIQKMSCILYGSDIYQTRSSHIQDSRVMASNNVSLYLWLDWVRIWHWQTLYTNREVIGEAFISCYIYQILWYSARVNYPFTSNIYQNTHSHLMIWQWDQILWYKMVSLWFHCQHGYFHHGPSGSSFVDPQCLMALFSES